MIEFIFLVIFTITTIVNGQSETACVGVDNAHFVNNAMGCEYFYGCYNQQVTHSGQCPPGFFFEPILQYCDYPNNVNCEQCSPRGIQNIAIPGSCTRFIRCTQGIGEIEQCSPGLHFDTQLGRCSTPTFCMSDSAEVGVPIPPPEEPFPPPPEEPFPPPPEEPFPPPPEEPFPPPPPPPGHFEPDCSGAQIFHAHPTDCSRFFICVNGAALPGQCQDGQLWNQIVNNCDNPLNTVCFNQ